MSRYRLTKGVTQVTQAAHLVQFAEVPAATALQSSLDQVIRHQAHLLITVAVSVC